MYIIHDKTENTIAQKIEKLRMERWFKDMNQVYKKLEVIVQDEMDTSLEQFFYDYFDLKKSLNK